MSFDRPDLTIGTRDWSPGYLDTPESDTLPEGAIVAGRNAFFHAVDLDARRARATTGRRPGSRLLTAAAAAGSVRYDGIVDFRREAHPSQCLVAIGGAWYRWNELDAPLGTIAAIATAVGYVAGNPGRGTMVANQAWLTDGSKQQLYDGLTARDPGFVKPTGVTALALGAAPGVTGTYSARYTWFDQAHNHESSGTDDATASLAFTNQARVHTKPSGAPPAHVTHWRAYVRREDTSESKWMRVATVPIADATVSEAIVDEARKDPLPAIGANDPPTVVFKVVAQYLGYTIGFPAGSSDMHVSKQGDPESWNPSDILKVNAGDGKGVRAATRIGESNLVIQKPTSSFRLVGERMPFVIREVNPNFGSVSAEACVTVSNRLFAWDEAQGPYWTDLTNWISLADSRIEKVLATVGKLDTPDIRAFHHEECSLVGWAVPTFGSPRKRTILAYHYGLEQWLPPMTGLEYAALCSYVSNDGTSRLLMGDYWGRLWSLFDGLREAPLGGTVDSTVTSATASTLTDTAAAFVTTGAGLAGVPVAVQNPSTGAWQWRRIASNTATVLTLDTTHGTPFAAVPASGWPYLVGGIEWWQMTPWMDGKAPLVQKALLWFALQFKPAGDAHAILVAMRFNEGDEDVEPVSRSFTALTGAALWGFALWGVGVWSSVARRDRKTRIGRTAYSVQVAFSNYAPDQACIITGFAIGADVKSRRSLRSARA